MPTELESRVFGDNSATEFHKLHCEIWQNLPRKNVGPGDAAVGGGEWW